MSKQTGLGDNLYVGGYDLSGDIGSLSGLSTSRGTLEDTGIDKSAMERLHGLRDGGLEFSAYFNKDTGRAHPVLSALPSSDRVVSYFRGTTLGGKSAVCVAKQLDYAGTRSNDGALAFSTGVQANGFGLEWGVHLTAGKKTDAAAANGTGVDFAASTDFGLQAYLQVFAFTGTDVTVKLQESSDNGSGDAWADVIGGGFTQITGGAPLAERIQTARGQTVERWLRVITETSGGFSNLIFAVTAVKNERETNF